MFGQYGQAGFGCESGSAQTPGTKPFVQPGLPTSPSAFDQGYLNHVAIPTANFGAGEHQWAHTDYDMASVERTTDAARVYAFLLLQHLSERT